MNVKQVLMGHANISSTIYAYAKAGNESERAAQGKVVRLGLPSKVETIEP